MGKTRDSPWTVVRAQQKGNVSAKPSTDKSSADTMFCSCSSPNHRAQGLLLLVLCSGSCLTVLKDHSWQGLENLIGCKGLNPGHSCAKQVPKPGLSLLLSSRTLGDKDPQRTPKDLRWGWVGSSVSPCAARHWPGVPGPWGLEPGPQGCPGPPPLADSLAPAAGTPGPRKLAVPHPAALLSAGEPEGAQGGSMDWASMSHVLTKEEGGGDKGAGHKSSGEQELNLSSGLEERGGTRQSDGS